MMNNQEFLNNCKFEASNYFSTVYFKSAGLAPLKLETIWHLFMSLSYIHLCIVMILPAPLPPRGFSVIVILWFVGLRVMIIPRPAGEVYQKLIQKLYFQH